MPNLVTDLMVNRVDFVDEGANSEAFIEIYKRKEHSTTMKFDEIIGKLKPEEADVIKNKLSAVQAALDAANEKLGVANSTIASKDVDLAKAKEKIDELMANGNDGECMCDGEEDENGVCKECGKPKKTKKSVSGVDETEVLKGISPEAKAFIEKLKAQKEAAEEVVRKNAEEAKQAEAIAKAASLKALPVKQEDLIEVVKSCDDKMLDMLTTINAVIEGTVLEEVGKNAGNGAGTASTDAWSTIEKKAEELAEREGITKAKAITKVIKENPGLYKDYLTGGAK